MYPLHTDDYVPCTCYSIASELVHHLHNINNGALRNVDWQFGQITGATVRYAAHQHINLYW